MSNGAEVSQQLAAPVDDLAAALANLAAVIAHEASCNAGFRARLTEALVVGRPDGGVAAPEGQATPHVSQPSSGGAGKTPSRRGRRAPGPWDPYEVYAEVGEQGLTERLNMLELEQLRDIVAEHGMNHDGKAMRWKAVDRVIRRIVERVVDRAGKGDAFRTA